MSATIHYLRPFEREDLSKIDQEPEPEMEAVDEEAAAPERARTRRHQMPCGRNSRFKKRMDGKVVPRDKP
jgi:hypothetical protein